MIRFVHWESLNAPMLTSPQLGQVLDETAAVAPGKLLLSTKAWRELLGHSAEDLISLGKADGVHLSCNY
jgi:hypothetical protein